MSRLNIAAPGEAFYTVWYVEQIAHAALSMNVSMSAGWTEFAMSNSEVRIIVPKTWCTRSQMAFACGFLIVVGLRLMPYESHNVSKCNLNSDPLSYIIDQHYGYLHNQILLTNRLIQSDDLSKISSSFIFFCLRLFAVFFIFFILPCLSSFLALSLSFLSPFFYFPAACLRLGARTNWPFRAVSSSSLLWAIWLPILHIARASCTCWWRGGWVLCGWK